MPNLTVSTFKQTTLLVINRVWFIQQLIHLQPLQVHCIIKVTLYLGIQWMYNVHKTEKRLRLISYRAISHTGFVYPTTWGNSPCSVRYRAEGGSLPSYTPTVPPAQRWLFRETCVSRAKDKAGVLNAFIQFNPLPRETIELDGRPIETSISKNYSCKLWNFCFFCLFGFFPSATITVRVPSKENATQSWKQWNLHAQMMRNREKQFEPILYPAKVCFFNCSWNN